MHAKREVWEKSVAKDWTGSRFGPWVLSLEFCSLSRCFSMNLWFRDQLVTGDEKEREFPKGARCERVVQFWRPCRGLTHLERCVRSSRDNQHMACRDGDSFRPRRAILVRRRPREIELKMLGGFSKSYFTKIKISRDPVDRFWWKAVRFELKVCSFRFWKRELPENFSRKDWTGSRFRKWSNFRSAIEKTKGIVFWAALPGAQALTGFRPQRK